MPFMALKKSTATIGRSSGGLQGRGSGGLYKLGATPPDSWEENGGLHPSSSRIWTLPTTVWAWKWGQAPESTAAHWWHLFASRWDPGQGTSYVGPGFLTQSDCEILCAALNHCCGHLLRDRENWYCDDVFWGSDEKEGISIRKAQ